MGFFDHYRSVKAHGNYPVWKCSQFQQEFTTFEKYIEQYWSLKTCKQFYMSIRTNSVSFFSTRLFDVPNVIFPLAYSARIEICGMCWNQKHISECYKNLYVDTDIAYRKNLPLHVHTKVLVIKILLL